MSKKWLVKIGIDEREYDSFDEAVAEFRQVIFDFVSTYCPSNEEEEPCIAFNNSAVPNFANEYFYYKYDSSTISDEEIILDNRLRMLMEYLYCPNLDELKEATLGNIKHSYKYEDEIKEINSKLYVDIDYSPDEVKVYLSGNEGFLETNAFIFDDEDKKYYFESNQVVRTSSNPDDLGSVVFLNIYLTCKQ